MLLRTAPLTAAVLLASGVSAFKDAAPFFLLSSHPLNSTSPIESSQILPAKDVQDAVLNSALIKSCKADVTLVRQSGLTAADFHNMPSVKRVVDAVKEREGAAFLEVAEVLGAMDVGSLEQEVGRRCGDGVVRVVSEMGKKNVKETDSKLASVLKEADNGKPYVVIFSGSASTREAPPYEMDEAHPELHIDLRRDVESYQGRSVRRADNDKSKQAALPLFETYQFFTPALFMGLGVSLLLFFILYVGVSAIANLEVSYAAFSKEMGPQAQKKQQ